MGSEETLDVRVARIEERDRAEADWKRDVKTQLSTLLLGIQEINIKLATADAQGKGRGDVFHWIVTGTLGVAQVVTVWRAMH